MDKWLNHPNSLKIISVILALLLWAVVHFDPETPNTVASLIETKSVEAVKVQVEGLDDKKYQLRLIEPEAVRITVRGNRTDLQLTNVNDYKAVVNLTGITEGIHDVPLNVTTPRRIQLMEQSHNRVTVQLEPILTKEFQANIVTTGTPAYDYKTGTPVVKPENRVIVTLPEDRMNQVSMVGATVAVDGEEETINRKRVKLIVYDKEGEEMSEAVVEPSVVEVEIPIIKPAKQVPIRLGMSGKLPNGISLVSIKPEVVVVTIYGPQEELDKYEYYDHSVLNLSSIRQSGTASIDLKPMQGVASVNPVKLNIEVEVAASEVRSFQQIPISVTGLSQGLDHAFVTPDEGRMNFQVKGAPALLERLVARDIRLSVDLNGLAPGEHTVPIEAELPSYLEPGENGQLRAKISIIDPAAAAAAPDEPGEEQSAADNIDGGNNPATPGNASNSAEPDNQSGAEGDGNNTNAGQGENNPGPGNGTDNSTS
ncbi:YbbR-like domain-containing protein [Paenibacillus tarimensis]